MTLAKATICIPAYKSATCVSEAIQSVRAQTVQDLDILISVDPAGDETEEVCARHAAMDRRIRVLRHEKRLGWVGNFNACLSQVQAPFVGFCMNDDRLHPRYVETLIDTLEAHPQAICANGWIERQGEAVSRDPISRAYSVVGSTFARVHQRFTQSSGAYSLKDLYRADALKAVTPLPDDIPENYNADLVFILRAACAGDFIAVPEVLYYKSFSDDSVTGGYRTWPPDRLMPCEIALRTALIKVIQTEAKISPDERAELTELILARPPLVYGHKAGVDTPELQIDWRRWMDLRGSAEIITSLMSGRPATHPTSNAGARERKARERMLAAKHALDTDDPGAALSHSIEATQIGHSAPARAHTLAARAARALSRNNNDALKKIAHDNAEKATRLDPEFHVGWQLLSASLEAQGDYTGALETAQTAHRLAPPAAKARLQALIDRLAIRLKDRT